MSKVTSAQLLVCGWRGRYAVCELQRGHYQEGCNPVPKGTRFIAVGRRARHVVALIPHDALPLEQRVFSDGHIRIVHNSNFKVVGRIN